MSPDRPIFRSASAPPERPMDSRTLDAEKAESVIRRTMMEGGSCSIEVEGRRRELVHDPRRDAPLRGWPWPFTLIAPHRVRLVIWEGAMRGGSVTYDRKRIDEAIKYFLLGAGPKAKVIVTRERFGGGHA